MQTQQSTPATPTVESRLKGEVVKRTQNGDRVIFLIKVDGIQNPQPFSFAKWDGEKLWRATMCSQGVSRDVVWESGPPA